MHTSTHSTTALLATSITPSSRQWTAKTSLSLPSSPSLTSLASTAFILATDSLCRASREQ